MVHQYDSLSLEWGVCKVMLFVNALWDFISAACIWHSFCISDVIDLLNSSNSSSSRVATAEATENNSTPTDTESQAAEATTTTTCRSISLRHIFERDERSAKIISQIGWRNALCLAIAEMHTSLWATKTDTTNHAACMLMAWWVLTLGMIRFFACLDREYVALAAVSYAVEGIFFLAESLKSTMTPKKSCYVSIFCFACLLICVVKIPSTD
jgi:hypothetical protein